MKNNLLCLLVPIASASYSASRICVTNNYQWQQKEAVFLVTDYNANMLYSSPVIASQETYCGDVHEFFTAHGG